MTFSFQTHMRRAYTNMADQLDRILADGRASKGLPFSVIDGGKTDDHWQVDDAARTVVAY